jgi:hypothetical protein
MTLTSPVFHIYNLPPPPSTSADTHKLLRWLPTTGKAALSLSLSFFLSLSLFLSFSLLPVTAHNTPERPSLALKAMEARTTTKYEFLIFTALNHFKVYYVQTDAAIFKIILSVVSLPVHPPHHYTVLSFTLEGARRGLEQLAAAAAGLSKSRERANFW